MYLFKVLKVAAVIRRIISLFKRTYADFCLKMPIGVILRSFLLRGLFKKAGRLRIHENVVITGFECIELADNVEFKKGTAILVQGGVLKLGDGFATWPGTVIDVKNGICTIGSGSHTGESVIMICSNGELFIGNNFVANLRTLLHAGNSKITIGDNCILGYECKLIATKHSFDKIDIPIREQDSIFREISLGDDIWLASGVIISCGVTVGSHSIIGAGAVVTRNVDPWSLYGGVPARKIRSRLS